MEGEDTDREDTDRETNHDEPVRQSVPQPVAIISAAFPQPPITHRDSRRASKLRKRVRRLYALRDLELTVGEDRRAYRVALPADPDAPLDDFTARAAHWTRYPVGGRTSDQHTGGARDVRMAALRAAANDARRTLVSGEHMPYWALLWASGLALAEELTSLSSSLPCERKGRLRALELGCGLGVTAAVAVAVGLDVWAADCFPEAVAFCRYNTLRNTGRMPRTAVLDWRTEAGRTACLALGRFDLLLAADVLYEEQDVAPLLELAPRLLAPGGSFWLAEPGRRVARVFIEAARARGWRDDERVCERAWPPDGDAVRVVVHRLTGLSADGR